LDVAGHVAIFGKNTSMALYPQTTINCAGKLLSLETPQVMGILNVTPDSFYTGSRLKDEAAILQRAEQMLEEGAVILDVGGMSTRQGAQTPAEEEELSRVLPAVKAISRHFPAAIISVDTLRASVAKAAVEAGAAMINDVSAGRIDPEMYATVAGLGTPYVLMHMQGVPQNMHLNPHYDDVVLEILDFFIAEAGKLRALGVKDIILDPGLGFGKKINHNFELLRNLHAFGILDMPIMVGVSRKSMIYKTLDISPEEALHGTAALHMLALQQGARILRAHDVAPALQVIQLWKAIYAAQ
jgi:dihydropteroate synthase